MIRLGQTLDGRLIIGASVAFPHDVKHVEYYRDQKLFNLVYDTPEEDSDLMPCEMTADVATIVESSPDVIIVARGDAGTIEEAYQIPLIQIGF